MFTIIAWDPPGQGFSRPPERDFKSGVQVYFNDADMGAALMKTLGYHSYCVCGWSFGVRVALCLALRHPSKVEKLVLWGGCSHYDPGESRLLSSTADTASWSESKLAPFAAIYGREHFHSLWGKQCVFVKVVEDVCKDRLDEILCPTLILHGDKDVLVPFHLVKYLSENISDSRIYRFPEGAHDIHKQFTQEFNREVTEFLMD